MEEAGARSKREANETVDQSDILEYLAFSIYKQGGKVATAQKMFENPVKCLQETWL